MSSGPTSFIDDVLRPYEDKPFRSKYDRDGGDPVNLDEIGMAPFQGSDRTRRENAPVNLDDVGMAPPELSYRDPRKAPPTDTSPRKRRGIGQTSAPSYTPSKEAVDYYNAQKKNEEEKSDLLQEKTKSGGNDGWDINYDQMQNNSMYATGLNEVLGVNPPTIGSVRPDNLDPLDPKYSPEEKQNVIDTNKALDEISADTIILSQQLDGLSKGCFPRRYTANVKAGFMAFPNQLVKFPLHLMDLGAIGQKVGNLAGAAVIDTFSGEPGWKESAKVWNKKTTLQNLATFSQKYPDLTIDAILPTWEKSHEIVMKEGAKKGFDNRAQGAVEEAFFNATTILLELLATKSATGVAQGLGKGRLLAAESENFLLNRRAPAKVAKDVSEEVGRQSFIWETQKEWKNIDDKIGRLLGQSAGLGAAQTIAKEADLTPETSVLLSMLLGYGGNKGGAGLDKYRLLRQQGISRTPALTSTIFSPRANNMDLAKMYALKEYAGRFPTAAMTSGGLGNRLETLSFQSHVGVKEGKTIVASANDEIRDSVSTAIWGEDQPKGMADRFEVAPGDADQALGYAQGEIQNIYQRVAESFAPEAFETKAEAVKEVSKYVQRSYENNDKWASLVHEKVYQSIPEDSFVGRRSFQSLRSDLERTKEKLSVVIPESDISEGQLVQFTQTIKSLTAHIDKLLMASEEGLSTRNLSKLIKELNQINPSSNSVMNLIKPIRGQVRDIYMRALKNKHPGLDTLQKVANDLTGTKYEMFNSKRDQIRNFMNGVRINQNSSMFDTFTQPEMVAHLYQLSTYSFSPVELQESLDKMYRTQFEHNMEWNTIYGTDPASRGHLKFKTIRDQNEWVSELPPEKQPVYKDLYGNLERFRYMSAHGNKVDRARADLINIAYGEEIPSTMLNNLESKAGILTIDEAAKGNPFLENLSQEVKKRYAWDILTGGALPEPMEDGTPAQFNGAKLAKRIRDPKIRNRLTELLGEEAVKDIEKAAYHHEIIMDGMNRLKNFSGSGVLNAEISLLKSFGTQLLTWYQEPIKGTKNLAGLAGAFAVGKWYTDPEFAKASRILAEQIQTGDLDSNSTGEMIHFLYQLIKQKLTREEQIALGIADANPAAQALSEMESEWSIRDSTK